MIRSSARVLKTLAVMASSRCGVWAKRFLHKYESTWLQVQVSRRNFQFVIRDCKLTELELAINYYSRFIACVVRVCAFVNSFVKGLEQMQHPLKCGGRRELSRSIHDL